MQAIFKKEFRQYFTSFQGWLFLFVFLLLFGVYFSVCNLLSASGELSASFQSMVLLLIILLPILTMQSIAGEKRARTDQLLLTAPVTVGQIVLGKFLAVFCVLLLAVVPTLPYAVILAVYGSPIGWHTVLCYTGFLLLGAAFIACGIFISALTDSPTSAAVLSYAGLFLLWYAGDIGASVSQRWLQDALNFLSFRTRYAQFMLGQFDPSTVLYFLSATALSLFLAAEAMRLQGLGLNQKRRSAA